MQFRIMHPNLRQYSFSDNPAKEPPMLISRLRASSGGFGNSQLDLFDQDLAVLIFPIGKGKRLSGLFIMGVHHEDIHLFDQVLQRRCISRQDGMDWLFSWEKEEYKRVPDEMDDYSDQSNFFELWSDNDMDEAEQARQQRSRWLVDKDER